MQKGYIGANSESTQAETDKKQTEVMEELARIKESMSKMNNTQADFRGSNSLQTVDMGTPMNDSQRRISINDDANLDKKDLLSAIKELKKRVAYLEDEVVIPRTADRLDVPLKLLGKSATLGEVIKAVNILIQREIRGFSL